mmetsp:Transcript_64561/g.102728  ORF Transcript_64561/g.102728 Transcript_64561/m.102728 type:complete len:308 (+) Transcript_64561:121-1044(+)
MVHVIYAGVIIYDCSQYNIRNVCCLLLLLLFISMHFIIPDGMATRWTIQLRLKPGIDAFAVKLMETRQCGHFITDSILIQANPTSLRLDILHRQRAHWQSIDKQLSLCCGHSVFLSIFSKAHIVHVVPSNARQDEIQHHILMHFVYSMRMMQIHKLKLWQTAHIIAKDFDFIVFVIIDIKKPIVRISVVHFQKSQIVIVHIIVVGFYWLRMSVVIRIHVHTDFHGVANGKASIVGTAANSIASALATSKSTQNIGGWIGASASSTTSLSALNCYWLRSLWCIPALIGRGRGRGSCFERRWSRRCVHG